MEAKANNVGHFGKLTNAGDFILTVSAASGETPAGMIYVCPCGCGDHSAVQFSNFKHESPKWDWNGDREKPTLTPSILRTAGCRWHGYLTDGVFRSC